LLRSIKEIEFGDVILFTDTTALPATPGIRVVIIAPLTSIDAYSHFVMRELGAHIKTSHVLLTQWDGFVRQASAWRDSFLTYDYIGAPWARRPIDSAVGNGGFSLRSRKLLDALQDPDCTPGHPEDAYICQEHRELLEQRYGLKFAPFEVAMQFSQERVTTAQPGFGFHGAFHLPDVLPLPELQSLIQRIPPSVSRSVDMRDLTRVLLEKRDTPHLEMARQLVEKRFSSGLMNSRQLRLWCALIWSEFRVKFFKPN
jgi:Protein of unknown function (DUF5672)